MKVLLDFEIVRENSDSFRFWSCVLETDVFEINYDYFNHDNEKKINSTFSLKLIASDFSEDKIDETKFIKRLPIFLSKGYESESPYQDSCSLLINYYPTFDFYGKLDEFLDIHECKRVMLVKQILKLIREWIGIDIIKSSSIPGCIAAFIKYNAFSIVDSNFNVNNGERFIKFYASKKSDFLIGIEINDNEKLLYKNFKSFENQQELLYLFPDINELEPFYEIKITICEKNKQNEWQTVFENKQNLVKYVRCNGIISGGNTRIQKNRYLNKTEKAVLSESTVFSTEEKSSIIDDFENQYHKLYVGKSLKYLKSFYFDRTKEGREGFIKWAKNEFNNAKEVILVDPYFDLDGLNDFCVCATSYFNFTLITENSNISGITEKQYLANIQANFPRAKVYFVKEKLHDRYLFIKDSYDEEKCFSLTNSWNGTVKNYDLYVHEVEYEILVQLQNFYFPLMDEKNLQRFSVKKVLKKSYYSKKKFTKKYITELDNKIKLGTTNATVTNYLSLIEDAYWACYCGKYLCKSSELDEKIYNILKNINISTLLDDVIQRLLNDQKKNFQISRRYIDSISEKSISDLTTTTECLTLLRNRVYSGMPSYDLELNYSLFKISKILFYIAPNEFIEKLVDEEKRTCIVNDIPYFISEPIISAILDSYQLYLINNDKIIDFSNKVDNLFCKLYIAKRMLTYESEESPQIDLIRKFKFSNQSAFQKECEISIYADLRNQLSIISTEKTKEIVVKIDKFIVRTYSNESYSYSLFVLRTFIKEYKLDFEGLTSFIENLSTPQAKNQIKHIVLFDAVNRTNDNKLRDYLFSRFTSEEKQLVSLLPQCDNEEKKSIVDVNKYINYIPFLSSILCDFIEDDEKSLVYKFRVNKYLIFDTLFDTQTDFDVYKLTIILGALKKKGLDRHIAGIEWFIPTLINSNQVDFYGLNLELLDIYINLLKEDEINKLVGRLKSIENKIIVASSDISCFFKLGIDLKAYFSSFYISKNDNLKSLTFLLFVFINISIQKSCSENFEYQKALLKIIGEKLKEYSYSEKIQNLVDEGINYFFTESNKQLFLNKLKECYLPVTAMDFFGVDYE